MSTRTLVYLILIVIFAVSSLFMHCAEPLLFFASNPPSSLPLCTICPVIFLLCFFRRPSPSASHVSRPPLMKPSPLKLSYCASFAAPHCSQARFHLTRSVGGQEVRLDVDCSPVPDDEAEIDMPG